jgi:hypothetical protein
MRRTTKSDERGFALLMVFLMAAVIALYLYAQLPRIAFESEREKEQTLIDRGEQYKRAIQLYVIATKKFPQKIEDLENTNEKRYLRRRYIDPMTGKDEWRLIHVNAAGILTDSLVEKPPTPDGKAQPSGGALASTSPDPSATTPGATDVNAAVRRRPSDIVGQAYTAPATSDPNDPSTWAPITIAPVGTSSSPQQGQTPSGAVGFNGGLNGTPLPGQAPGINGQPGAMAAPNGFPLPGQPGFNPTLNQFKIDANGQLVPITPTATTQAQQAINSQTGGVQNTPLGAPITAPGVSPLPGGIAAQNQATQAINQLLTNPNPQAGAGGLGTAGGLSTGGIAGVASNYKGPSIKVYKTRQKYQEWEFIFSLNDQRNAVNTNRNPLGGQGQPGQNGQQQQNGTQSPAGSGFTLGTTTGSTGNP